MSSTSLTILAEAIIAVAIIAAVTVLIALGKIDQSTGIALYGAAVALIGGTTKAQLALKVPAPPQNPPAA